MKTVTKQLSMFAFAVTSAVGLALAGNAAQAGDLASWSKVIPNLQDRFVSLSDFNHEAFLDQETQLVWLSSPMRSVATWTQARDYCLNVEANTDAGFRRGFRLPSVHELGTLSQQSTSFGPSGSLVDDIDWRGGREHEFWSATSVAQDHFDGLSGVISGLYGTTTDEVLAYSFVFSSHYWVNPVTRKRQKDERLGVICVRGYANSDQY